MIPSAVNLPLSDMKDALDPKTAEGDFFRVSWALGDISRSHGASSTLL